MRLRPPLRRPVRSQTSRPSGAWWWLVTGARRASELTLTHGNACDGPQSLAGQLEFVHAHMLAFTHSPFQSYPAQQGS